MPEFSPESQHIAHAVMTNNTPKAWTYNAELYLVQNESKYASSGIVTFTLAAGAAQSISFPITMPAADGAYKVYLDISAEGVFIRGYVATEDVSISVPAPAEFEYSNLNLQLPYISVPGPEEGFYYYDISCDIKNVGGKAGTRQVSVWVSNHNFHVDPSSPSGYEWGKRTHPSFTGWASWAIPPGGLDWDAGTINLTLAPGGTYHFHHGGGGAAWAAHNWVQIRDNVGGESVIVKKYSGTRTS